MKKFFSKFIVINLIIIFFSFWFFNQFIVNEMTGYLIEKKEENLISQSQLIEREYYKFLDQGILKYEDLLSELNAMERFLDTRIGIVNRSGELFAASANFDENGMGKHFKEEDLSRVYEGNILIKKNINFSKTSNNFMFLAYPLTFYEKTHFALIMDASLPEIENAVRKVNSISLIAVFLLTSLFFIINLIIVKGLNDSVEEINRGIKEITKGNFEETINLYRDDSLGGLARSYNSMTADLKKYEEMRKNFISNLSHDMRTPLTSIMGFVQGIKDGTIAEEDRNKYLDIVLEESRRLIKMTNDILDLSNIQSGGLTFDMEYFDLNGTILNVLESLERNILDKEIDLSLDLQEGMTDAWGDELKIQRVIYNLVDNAIKFSYQEGKISIRTYEKNEKIYFAIANFGQIISLDGLPKVFNRFTKLDESRGQEKMGSGLGLSIVKEILKGHHEDIYVESSQEKGVVFTFSLKGGEDVRN